MARRQWFAEDALKLFDTVIAVTLGVLVLGVITVVSGRLPTGLQCAREQVAVIAAKANEKPGGEIQIEVRDAPSGRPITTFQYYVFDSDEDAMLHKNNVTWMTVNNSEGKAFVFLETTDEQRIVAVRVAGYRDCAFWEPVVGDRVLYFMNKAGGQRPSQSQAINGVEHLH